MPVGFAFAVVFLWLARPSWASIAVGTVVALPGLFLRALASGHVRKNEELTTSGPYAYTRNPLYLGSLIMAAGFAIAARNVWIVVFMLAIFLGIYLPVIRNEEEFLRRAFSGFDEYAQNVPRLLPRWSAFGQPGGAFSPPLYWQHREYNAFLGTAALMGALVAKLMWGLR